MGEDLEKMNSQGLVFSTEAIAGLAIVIALVAAISLLSENPLFQPNPREWQQTNAIINAQTNRLSNSLPANYTGPQDYYCYQLHDLNIDTGRPHARDTNHCEETR